MWLPLNELQYASNDDEVVFAEAGDMVSTRPQITLAKIQGYDVIVAQRWNKHDGMSVWRRARTPGSRLVFETDDDIYSITPDNWSAYHLFGKPEIQDAITHMAATADLITVSTAPLAEVMRERTGNENIAVLPNCIPGWACTMPRVLRDRPRVGWMGGASHGADMGIIADPVRRFLKRFPGWDVQLNATDYRPTIKAPEDRMFFTKWVPVYEKPQEFYASIDFDIGLCPLAPTTFARSKSGLKAIEYGSRGIPAVCADAEPYRDVITHGVDGFLVRDDHEWLHYMSILARDDELRAKMGEAARDMARRYLIEDHWQEWRDAYAALFPYGVP